MLRLIHQGGPIMWPLMLTSVISLAVVIDRLFFLAINAASRRPDLVENIFVHAENGNVKTAIQEGEGSKDFVARMLVEGLKQKDRSLQAALMRSANAELKQFGRGLSVLDTVITLAPLLGLLATVTGMIHAFGLLGARELDAPTVITGGIAEALTGTAFGLGIAIVALIPYNFLNARLEDARHEIEDAATRLELILKK